jgi:hypothetical protein
VVNKQHFDFLKIRQFNILISLEENKYFFTKENYIEDIENRIKFIKEELFSSFGSSTFMVESHQININIGGIFNPKDSKDGKFTSKYWMKLKRNHRLSDKKNNFEDQYAYDFIENIMQDLKFSVQKGRMSFEYAFSNID